MGPGLVHPEFVPDPTLTREEMESLQRRVAETAVFEDRLGFDPADLGLDGSLSLSTVRDGPLTGSPAGGPTGPEVGAESDVETSAPVVVGVDQAFLGERAISAIVALQDGAVIERAHAVSPLTIPYIPGLLSFREGNPILEAFETLSVEPDLAVFDGSGRIHYRQAGIATHVGVMLDLPSVGVAKRLLCGDPDEDPAGRPTGWRTPIRATDSVEAPAGTILGYAYQSRQYERGGGGGQTINPLYVSPGHRVSAETTVDLVAGLCGDYKLPEPTRLADAYADAVKQGLD